MRAAGTGRRGREEKERQKKRKMVGPTFGGPPGMEGRRMNLKEYAKWRSV
jgi:hypothetical protein